MKTKHVTLMIAAVTSTQFAAEVSIVANYGTVVYYKRSKAADNFNIQQAFNVSKMVKGEFDFVLSGNNQVYII